MLNALETTLLALGAAALGAILSFLGAQRMQRGQQKWQAAQDRLSRQIEIVRTLDGALADAERAITYHDREDSKSRWEHAYQEWSSGWVRLTPHLSNAELEARYGCIGMVLEEIRDMAASGDADRMAETTWFRIAHRAIGNARIGLAYWLRDEHLPPPSFPPTTELIQLLGRGDPQPFAATAPLMQWLKVHPQPSWRSLQEK